MDETSQKMVGYPIDKINFFEKGHFLPSLILNSCHGNISQDMNLKTILKHAQIANVHSVQVSVQLL